MSLSLERCEECLAAVDETVRRLEAEVETLSKHAALTQQANKELLEALRLADALLWGANMNAHVVEEKVRAALKKHGGGAT